MSIEEKDKVDFINTSSEDNDLVLLGITDHLPWKKNVTEHLLLLQDKINNYINFVLSGQMIESFPAAKGKNKVCIQVFFKFPPPKEAHIFISEFKAALKEHKVDLIANYNP
ncbi:DUF6572 domain-containing protein [Pantoea sp. C8B4]|uniref:DUF6572 domain-containing protein n=1 Tax=Pantoea sp. C8B4 TaxID=3243083 RepID=UPI003ED9E7CB